MKDWNKDYFKRIPSDLFDDPIWTGGVRTKKEAIIELYYLAHDNPNNTGATIEINGSMLRVQVGEAPKGLRFYAERWKWTTKKVSNFFKQWEELGYLTIKGNTPITVIKINGWILRKKHRGNTEETQRKHGGNRSDTAMRQLKSNNSKKINENKERVDPTSFDHSSLIDEYKDIDVNKSYERYLSYHDNPSDEGFRRWLDKDRRKGLNKKRKVFRHTPTGYIIAYCKKCGQKCLPNNEFQLREGSPCCGVEYIPDKPPIETATKTDLMVGVE